ncbi:hypothetical protein HPB50_021620 [Hyalomma asiaticum]|uniref:Uncharacterized protein n=1 Tax=Hyalomma asiaticum TaxID=266040 RepID=A0ACB7T119_HYAAI|nr:hypothetical protein HPB50_021620 [Hyalomma asiaticum]
MAVTRGDVVWSREEPIRQRGELPLEPPRIPAASGRPRLHQLSTASPLPSERRTTVRRIAERMLVLLYSRSIPSNGLPLLPGTRRLDEQWRAKLCLSSGDALLYYFPGSVGCVSPCVRRTAVVTALRACMKRGFFISFATHTG